jgi:hypothetical protein
MGRHKKVKEVEEEGNEQPKTEKKSKLSPKEQAFKQFKKDFNKQLNYFKFLKRVGNAATKDFKKAKKELKNGKTELAKKIIAKYQLMDINEWVKAVE